MSLTLIIHVLLKRRDSVGLCLVLEKIQYMYVLVCLFFILLYIDSTACVDIMYFLFI